MKLSGVPIGYVRGRSMRERLPDFPDGDTLAQARGVLIYEPRLIKQVARGLRTAMRVCALAKEGHPHRDYDDKDSVTSRFVSLCKSAFFLKRLLDEPNYQPGQILEGDDLSAPVFRAPVTSLSTLGPVIEFELSGRECEMVLLLRAGNEINAVLQQSKAKGIYRVKDERIVVGGYLSAKRVEFAINAATGLGVSLLSLNDRLEIDIAVRQAIINEIGFLPFWADGHYMVGQGNSSGEIVQMTSDQGIPGIGRIFSRKAEKIKSAGLLLWRFKRVLPDGLDEATALRSLAQHSRALGQIPG